jgi:hypothetical protein
MGSEILRRESQDTPPTSTPEVEFALVLSRMIDSVKNDPQHLRETIYELARHKLEEQFSHENVKDMRPVKAALETAIQGVEAFARKHDQGLEAARRPEPAQERPQILADSQRRDAVPVARPAPPLLDVPVSRPIPAISVRSKPGFSVPWRFVTLVAVVVAAAIAIRQQGVSLDALRKSANLIMAPAPTQPVAAPIVPQVATAASEPPAAKPSPLVPTSYGIFAVSEDKLYELELLPGRAPDMRVAISPAITTPSRTTLPDGRLRFIVYRRGSAAGAADRAEVRVIAKVTRAMSFDAAGKAVVAKEDDSWVMRNISIPYRTAPNKDDPDMYDIQSENPEGALSPGRYALVIKGQSYDFSVDGAVTDPRQCLERLAASNGQFYSECQKP